MSEIFVHTAALMGTVVSIKVLGHGRTSLERREREDRVLRAITWFHKIEDACTRFEPTSEVRRLSDHIGQPVPVSAMLYSIAEFSLAVADESGGAFDPTVGLQMEERGFDREYRSGRQVRTPLVAPDAVTFRDVVLDPDRQTITLTEPLVLDLGAVAKGLAIDMAARELQPLENFSLDAGGDLYLGGRNEEGEPWSVGIQNPRDPEALIDTFAVSDLAVCTSGDYERHQHILDPRTREPAATLASVSVLATSAMVADALGTAAFVLGPRDGLGLLERLHLDALLVAPDLRTFETPELGRLRPGWAEGRAP